jgi:hypothetical protein
MTRPLARLADRRTVAVWLAAFLVLALAGCTGIGGTPAPTPGPTVTPGPAMSAGELRLFLIRELGPLWYCDPDAFPVNRDEQLSAIELYAEMVAEADLFEAVATQVGIDPGAAHSDADKLAIYRVWKVARAISLESIGNDRYRFDYLAQPVAGGAEGTRTAGTVDSRGAITVEQQAAAGEPMCPICLDRLTTIDTPAGPIAVDRLRLGDAVWTLDSNGRRVVGTVIALGSTPAPAGHQVVRVTLADGRTVSASPGHPLSDGRTFADLAVGDLVDGAAVVALESVDYAGGETFDLVVSGETSVYLAGGIPLASTLQ